MFTIIVAIVQNLSFRSAPVGKKNAASDYQVFIAEKVFKISKSINNIGISY